jgi:3-phosphoglycerate kinase
MRCLDELDVSGKQVLRLDLNVPQGATRITDDGTVAACRR